MKRILTAIVLLCTLVSVQAQKNRTATKSNTNRTAAVSKADVREAVDMGLSVKWATCNIGASTPEGYGAYFAWGETKGSKDGKSQFSWKSYSMCQGSESTMTKYCTNAAFGTTDGQTQLSLDDDAARAKWGGEWRMPTCDEMKELLDKNNCEWTLTTQNKVAGYKVTSKKTGNSIFLPAGGFRDSSGGHYGAGHYGDYWSSTLNAKGGKEAYGIEFSIDFDAFISDGARYCGQAIRPVCP